MRGDKIYMSRRFIIYQSCSLIESCWCNLNCQSAWTILGATSTAGERHKPTCHPAPPHLFFFSQLDTLTAWCKQPVSLQIHVVAQQGGAGTRACFQVKGCLALCVRFKSINQKWTEKWVWTVLRHSHLSTRGSDISSSSSASCFGWVQLSIWRTALTSTDSDQLSQVTTCSYWAPKSQVISVLQNTQRFNKKNAYN